MNSSQPLGLQLLVHTSGIPDYAGDPAGIKTKSIARTPAQMLEWIAGLEPRFQFEPGARWAYSNSNYALLGMGVFVTATTVGRRVWHSGDIDGFSTWLAHYPEVDVTIAVMQNSESADVDEAALHDALFAQPGCTLGVR